MREVPYSPYLFHPETRHLFLFAHQDDELPYLGLIQRLRARSRFLWLTNGDGLAPGSGMSEEDYAEMRIAETDCCMKTAGVDPDSQMHCYRQSEIWIYSMFADLIQGRNREQCLESFIEMADDMAQAVIEYKPDVVWTLAWQGGHPEHDLVHMIAARAVGKLAKDFNHKVDFYHLPEYEYTIFIPMRFHPMYKGPIHRIELTDEEFAVKYSATECFPSQHGLFRRFEKVINRLGFLRRPFGPRYTYKDFATKEYFAPVPLFDYRESTHWFDACDYIRDDYRGVPISHKKAIRPIAEAFFPDGNPAKRF